MQPQQHTHSKFFDKYSLFTGITFGILSLVLVEISASLSISAVIIFISTISILMTLQGAFSLYWMIYTWEDAKHLKNKSPADSLLNPAHSFTAIIPARHESAVIADTIRAVDAINYPAELKEILIVCRSDDTETIQVANQTIQSLNQSNIRIVQFNDNPINKPHGLKIGLNQAHNEVIVVFDAEDQPHPDIYLLANTTLISEKADVVQAGVQLMNFRSSWFSALNVLEYYFWFKSTLHFFASVGTVPLGGNTVFFKRDWLHGVNGWDETCLTEDADIGIRLCNAGAKIKVVYDERYVTREETPPTLTSFVKQRTRWNQGFIQILQKGDWLKLPTLSQKLLSGYILLLPEIQALLFLLIPLSVLLAFTAKLPILITLLSYIPFLILLLQLIIQTVGLYEFTKSYKLKFPLWMPLQLFITFYPYQILLSVSALRAIMRTIIGNIGWEKTQHINAHRNEGIVYRPAKA